MLSVVLISHVSRKGKGKKTPCMHEHVTVNKHQLLKENVKAFRKFILKKHVNSQSQQSSN